MKNLFTLLFVAYAILLSNEDYYLIEEYFNKNPSEKIISETFSQTVAQSPIPISSSNKKIKIVMLYPGNQISDYWRRSKDSFKKRLDALEISYELIDYFTRPFELTKQATILNKILGEDVDYLVFTLDSKKHGKFIERIINKKKPKIILQNITNPKKRWEGRQPFLYVGFDHVTGAKMLADKYIVLTEGKGEYAVLLGNRGYVSDMRGKEFIKYISDNSRLELKEIYYTDFNKKKAKEATLDLLKREKNLKFIYACSTDIALGALEALKEKKLLGKIVVNGWGGGSVELEKIKAKELEFTVMRNNDDNGVAMAEAIKLDILNKSSSIPVLYSGEFSLIEKGIDEKSLNALKEKAFRYSGVK